MKGFDSYTKAVQLGANPHFEKLLEPLGYYVESVSIHRSLIQLCSIIRSLDLDTLKKAHVWFGYAPHLLKLTIFDGFILDYASVPRPGWVVISPKEIRRPAAFHDALYRAVNNLRKLRIITRSQRSEFRYQADRLFREQMEHVEPSLPRWKKVTAYRFVRLFGGFTTAQNYEHLRNEN